MDASLTEQDKTPLPLVATVVITTRNRKADLEVALQSALLQCPKVGVLVVDDASTDGTVDMIRMKFPEVHLETSERPVGYIVQRNRAAKLVQTPFIVSIDDDAAFTQRDTVHRTIAEFSLPEIGAVAMPYINVNVDTRIRQKALDGDDICVTHTFIGTAHALRTDLFHLLKGYRELFYMQFEEQDYCLRMLEAGYFVRLGSTEPIHHFQSPVRVHGDIVFYGERNQILLAWLDSPRFLKEASGVLWRAFRRAASRRSFLLKTFSGLLAGCAGCWTYRRLRRPVSLTTYRLFRKLMRSGGNLTLQS